MQKRITPRYFINKTFQNKNKPEVKYNLRKVVGEGAQGFVFEALQLDINQIVGIKLLFSKNQNELDTIDHLMSKGVLEGIIGFYDHFDFDEYYIIVMQLGQLDLFKFLKQQKNILDSERMNLCRKISKCVLQFHHLNLIHCDIKPENFLLINNEFKICDFGCVRQQQQEIIKNVGTPAFQAIELLSNQAKAEKSLDIWSLGCVFYEIFSCQELFSEINGADKLQYLIDQSQIQQKIANLNTKESMRLLIMKMVNISPEQRPNINEILNQIDEIRQQKIEDWI